MAVDLVIDIENTTGALARVAAEISDAGVNIAAATCIGAGERAELHILVPHAGAAKHALGISNLAVTREREVVVVDVEDRPGVLGIADPVTGAPRSMPPHAPHRRSRPAGSRRRAQSPRRSRRRSPRARRARSPCAARLRSARGGGGHGSSARSDGEAGSRETA